MSTDEPVDGVALCLSGGGYRAMLFHVGVVWRLHDAGLAGAPRPRLERVRRLDHRGRARASPGRGFDGRRARRPGLRRPGARAGRPHRRRDLGDRRRAHPRHDLRARRQGLPPPPVRRRDAAGPARPPALRHQRDQRPVGRAVPLLQALHGRLARRPRRRPGRRARRRGRGLVRVPARPLPLRRSTCATRAGSTSPATTSATASTASARSSPTAASTTTSASRRPGRAAARCSSRDAGGQMAAEPDPDHDWGRAPVPRAQRDRQPGPLAAQARAVVELPSRASASGPTGASARTSPTSTSPTRCRRPRRDARLATTPRGSRGSTNRAGAAHQLGLRGLRRRDARARRPGAARAGRLPLSSGGDRRRDAPAAPARAVGLRPRPAAPLHAGLAGHARRLDGVRPRARSAPRPAARAAPRGRRRRARARAGRTPRRLPTGRRWGSPTTSRTSPPS